MFMWNCSLQQCLCVCVCWQLLDFKLMLVCIVYHTDAAAAAGAAAADDKHEIVDCSV